MSPTDLTAYFSRIGYRGAQEPTLDTLRALQFAHVTAVPFENLDVLLGRRISLEPADIFRKLVTDRRGGYCFEQNSLFRDVLRTLGFTVTPWLARVRWQVPPEVKTPLTHMVLCVTVAGRPWLADTGFGSVGTTAPLALDPVDEQSTPHDQRRIIAREGILVHQVHFGGAWADVYQFRPEEPAAMDFEMGNLFSCTHPKAHFVNNLVVTLVRPDRRLVVLNHEFTVRTLTGKAETRPIGTAQDLLTLLAGEFGLHFPAGTRFGPPGAPWPV
jgi:N-hydroxyarylamine O-acetyltransferase